MGDVIPGDIASTVVADVSGIPVLECGYGTSGGQYALKVEKVLAGAQELSEQALAHGS